MIIFPCKCSHVNATKKHWCQHSLMAPDHYIKNELKITDLTLHWNLPGGQWVNVNGQLVMSISHFITISIYHWEKKKENVSLDFFLVNSPSRIPTRTVVILCSLGLCHQSSRGGAGELTRLADWRAQRSSAFLRRRLLLMVPSATVCVCCDDQVTMVMAGDQWKPLCF